MWGRIFLPSGRILTKIYLENFGKSWQHCHPLILLSLYHTAEQSVYHLLHVLLNMPYSAYTLIQYKNIVTLGGEGNGIFPLLFGQNTPM
jgi:hypothetical protein